MDLLDVCQLKVGSRLLGYRLEFDNVIFEVSKDSFPSYKTVKYIYEECKGKKVDVIELPSADAVINRGKGKKDVLNVTNDIEGQRILYDYLKMVLKMEMQNRDLGRVVVNGSSKANDILPYLRRSLKSKKGMRLVVSDSKFYLQKTIGTMDCFMYKLNPVTNKKGEITALVFECEKIVFKGLNYPYVKEGARSLLIDTYDNTYKDDLKRCREYRLNIRSSSEYYIENSDKLVIDKKGRGISYKHKVKLYFKKEDAVLNRDTVNILIGCMA